jgi:hypothetical protein
MTETPKPKGTMIRPTAELQTRIDAFHKRFFVQHKVALTREQTLLALIEAGLPTEPRRSDEK